MSLEKKLKQKYQWEVTEPNIGFNQGLSFALKELGRVADKIREKRKLNREGIAECEKTLKQEHYDSMTEEQRNAQAYAVFSALEGAYKEILDLLVEQKEEQK